MLVFLKRCWRCSGSQLIIQTPFDNKISSLTRRVKSDMRTSELYALESFDLLNHMPRLNDRRSRRSVVKRMHKAPLYAERRLTAAPTKANTAATDCSLQDGGDVQWQSWSKRGVDLSKGGLAEAVGSELVQVALAARFESTMPIRY